jgi:uncharacterized protein
MEVDQTFFALFPFSEIQQARLSVEVNFEKLGSQMNAQITLDGTIEVACDRCLGLFDLDVHFEDRVLAKLGEVTDFEEDVWVLGPEVHELDLSQPIFEFAHLALPTRRIHPDVADCDPDMLDRLDGPDEGGDDEEPMDPRWNALKELK